jgi:hypothetical protein
MNAPKNERRLAMATLKTTGSARICHFSLVLQREGALSQRTGEVKRCGFFHREKRRCICCGKRISNRSLGGYDGHSALTGPLWCLRCC